MRENCIIWNTFTFLCAYNDFSYNKSLIRLNYIKWDEKRDVGILIFPFKYHLLKINLSSFSCLKRHWNNKTKKHISFYVGSLFSLFFATHGKTTCWWWWRRMFLFCFVFFMWIETFSNSSTVIYIIL